MLNRPTFWGHIKVLEYTPFKIISPCHSFMISEIGMRSSGRMLKTYSRVLPLSVIIHSFSSYICLTLFLKYDALYPVFHSQIAIL